MPSAPLFFTSTLPGPTGATGATGATGPTGSPGVAYTPRGAYAGGTTYAQGDEVTDASILYISLQGSNTGHTPASSPTWWQSLATTGITGLTTGTVPKAASSSTLSDSPIIVSGSNVGIGIIPWGALTAIASGYTTASLTHQSACTASFAVTASGTELAIFNKGTGSLAISLQGRHSGVDAQIYPICLNPLGGNVGIGTDTPTSALQVVGLSAYANNAAAVSGGLTAGAGYRFSGPTIASPSGGATIDTQARTAIDLIRAVLSSGDLAAWTH